jgi:hypothetical protein
MELGAQVESLRSDVVYQGLQGRNQASLLGTQQNSQGACHLQSYRLGQLACPRIVHSSHVAAVCLCVGDYGPFACSQAVGWQAIDQNLRHRYQLCPDKASRVDRVGAEDPAHVQLQTDLFRNIDWGKERRKQVNLTDAAQVQRYGGVAHEGMLRHWPARGVDPRQ